MARTEAFNAERREFFELPGEDDGEEEDTRSACGLDHLRCGLVGRLASFSTPFGSRHLVYADWTASGRAHTLVETYINEQVLPLYGNTHTTTSITGSQSTCFRHEARQIVAEAVNAKVTGRAAEDVVLFTGSGATAAIVKLVQLLGLHVPLPSKHVRPLTTTADKDSGDDDDDDDDDEMRPVVFVGPLEHHSNLLPWRESCAKVVAIQSDPAAGGALDLVHLDQQLRKYGGRGGGAAMNRLLIGSFAAASNVTGVVEDVDTVSRLLHFYGALSFWDYATAAPYLPINFNPIGTARTTAAEAAPTSAAASAAVAVAQQCSSASAHKDAVFFSPHKLAGGVNTPGVLVVKKRLLANKVPTAPGGGTVFYVTCDGHRYLSNREEREEGGTPDIVGAVRAGLALRLKRLASIAPNFPPGATKGSPSSAPLAVSTHSSPVLAVHASYLAMTRAAFRACPHLVLLGDDAAHGAAETNLALDPARRLPIFSFLVRWRARFLHYNFVGALLNDLFGVQTRGGCQCAGPYSQKLLGLSKGGSASLEKCLLEDKAELLRPGYSRFSLPYTLSPAEAAFVLSAVTFVAERGWVFLPLYRLNHKTGEVKHRSRATKFPGRKWLSHFTLDFQPASAGGAGADEKWHELDEEALRQKFDGLLTAANAAADEIERNGKMLPLVPSSSKTTGTAAASSSKKRPREEEQAAAKIPASALELQTQWLPSHDQGSMLQGTLAAEMRWFAYPSEAAAALATGGGDAAKGSAEGAAEGPIQPPAMMLSAQELADEEMEDEQRLMRRGSDVENDHDFDEQDADAMCAQAEQNGHEAVPTRPVKFKGVVVPALQATATMGVEASGGNGSSAHQKKKSGSAKYPARPADRSEPETPLYQQPHVLQTMLKSGVGVSLSGAEVDDGNSALSSSSFSQTSSAPTTGGGDDPSEIASAQSKKQKKQRKKNGCQLPVPGWKVMRAIGQAIHDWNMIEDGDRLVIGLSGGKDSLTLLFALLDLQRRAPIKFTVSAATVDPQTPSFDPSPLIPYLASLGVTYHFLSEPIVERAAQGRLQGDSLCSFCSRMKRGLLYTCCREHGYNKLVLGQHLDDLAESFIMSTLHNGQVRTMKANYRIEAGDVSVIRPLLYVREHQTKEFALAAQLPVINENCPACFEEPKERHRVKKMLAREEALAPEIFANMKTSLLPLMGEGIYPYMDLVRRSVDLNQQARRAPGQNQKKGAAKRARLLDAPAESSATGGTTATAAAAATAATTAVVTATTAATAEETVKWGSEVLAVLPDSWLEEECERRREKKRRAAAAAGGGRGSSNSGVAEDTNRAKEVATSEVAESSVPIVVGGSRDRVFLCGKANGKCEMFD
jgi:selenocysteine lyase/cysteine desulfurase/tRNA(Ile)-lysidine synthase TilS/MesJ